MPVRQRFGNWTNFLHEMGLKPIKFLPTKNGITRKGTRNKSRKRIKTRAGYIKVFEPDHPASTRNGYVLEHRMIAYDAKQLTDLSHEVHHINGIKDDNRLENLQVLEKAEHTTLTHKGRQVSDSYPQCKMCEKRTKSKYQLCQKHYKAQWHRMKRGLIDSIHEHPELLKHSILNNN